MDAVVRSGQAVSDTFAGFAGSWWMDRAAVSKADLDRRACAEPN